MSLFTVELKNQPGELARLCEAMAGRGVNLILCATTRGENCAVRPLRRHRPVVRRLRVTGGTDGHPPNRRHSSGPWPLVRRDQGPLPQLRPPGIVVAAGVLAAIAEEVALAGQDLENRCLSGSAEYGRLAGEAASRHEAKGLWQDDLHLAYGLGRAAD